MSSVSPTTVQPKSDSLSSVSSSPNDTAQVVPLLADDHLTPTSASQIKITQAPAVLPPQPLPPFVASPADFNTANLSKELLAQIVQRFQPAIWLDKDEQFRPATLDWYFNHVALYFNADGSSSLEKYIKLKERISENDLNTESLWQLIVDYRTKTNDPRLTKLTKEQFTGSADLLSAFYMSVVDEESQYGQPLPELNQIPFLTIVRRYQDYFEICYVATYAFNGPFTVCCKPVDAHSCDIEHITVRTNADATKLEWIFYAAHGIADGVWRKPTDSGVEMLPQQFPGLTEPTQAVAYSSSHSHGMYPSSGTWWRICGVANDIAGEASTPQHLWSPTVPAIQMFYPEDPRFGKGEGIRWMNYIGHMGEDGIDAVEDQGWFQAESEYTNNCFRRMWWPCRYIDDPKDCCYHSCEAHPFRNPPLPPPRSLALRTAPLPPSAQNMA